MIMASSDELLDPRKLLHHALMCPQSGVSVQDAAIVESFSVVGPLEEEKVDYGELVAAQVGVRAQNFYKWSEGL